MNSDSPVRTLIWKRMLTADLNYRYFGLRSARLQDWNRAAQLFVALVSSAGVSGWALWGRPGIDWIWQVLSALATVAAVAMPIVNLGSSVETASSLKGAWFGLLKEYELLWAQVDELLDAEALESCHFLASEEQRLVELEAAIREDCGLARRCEADVRRSRGLQSRRTRRSDVRQE